MAELEQQATEIIATAGSASIDLIIYLVIAILIGALAWCVFFVLSFKHKVRIRYLTKDGSFIIDDKAKRKEDGGVIVWNLFKQKIDVTPPPKEAINITAKGRLVAECYITEDNPEPVWLLDKGYNEAQEGFKPLTTQQRSLTVARIRKAQSRKDSTLWEKVSQVVMPIVMVIMIAIPFIFFGDITDAAQESLAQSAEVSKENAEIANQNARMLSIMAGKIEVGELQLKQNIPPDAVGVGG